MLYLLHLYGTKKSLTALVKSLVSGIPRFPAPMKKPPFVVKERFFSRLAVHYFVFLYVSLFTLLQPNFDVQQKLILILKKHLFPLNHLVDSFYERSHIFHIFTSPDLPVRVYPLRYTPGSAGDYGLFLLHNQPRSPYYHLL